MTIVYPHSLETWGVAFQNEIAFSHGLFVLMIVVWKLFPSETPPTWRGRLPGWRGGLALVYGACHLFGLLMAWGMLPNGWLD